MKTLNELFNTPVKYTTREVGGNYFYEFYVNGNQYKASINIVDAENDEYGFYFTNETARSVGVTDSGGALQVFATVIAIMKEFVKNMKPTMLNFSAKEQSRIKLYDRMVKTIAKGYKVSSSMAGGKKWYELIKK